MIYPVKYLEYISIVNELLSNKEFNLDNFKKVLTNFTIITKLAFKEIDQNKKIINKKIAISNYGLDFFEINFQKLINYANLYIQMNEIEQIVIYIDNIDYINKKYVIQF